MYTRRSRRREAAAIRIQTAWRWRDPLTFLVPRVPFWVHRPPDLLHCYDATSLHSFVLRSGKAVDPMTQTPLTRQEMFALRTMGRTEASPAPSDDSDARDLIPVLEAELLSSIAVASRSILHSVPSSPSPPVPPTPPAVAEHVSAVATMRQVVADLVLLTTAEEMEELLIRTVSSLDEPAEVLEHVHNILSVFHHIFRVRSVRVRMASSEGDEDQQMEEA